MPRISRRLTQLAQSSDPLLVRLLPVCRSLESARNELRWLRESHERQHIGQLVERRAKGEPLQYILGSEFFGDLEIKCKPGVLIPRQETAASVSYLLHRLLEDPSTTTLLPRRLRVLDLCTGSGCIPLLFHHEFYRRVRTKSVQLDLIAADISPAALALATENHQLQLAEQLTRYEPLSQRMQALQGLRLMPADVLSLERQSGRSTPLLAEALNQLPEPEREFDILISNPPYISNHQFRRVTARSVRRFEPRLALVPGEDASADISDGDQFYPRLWQIADQVNAKVVLFEVGDHQQAVRIADMSTAHEGWQSVEIWRDEPMIAGVSGEVAIDLGRAASKIVGSGNSRSVYATRCSSVKRTDRQ